MKTRQKEIEKKSQEHRRGGERKANAGGEGKRKHEREKKRKANA